MGNKPWLQEEYAKDLAGLSQRGIEVRIITSKENYNLDSIEILKASENPNLHFRVLDRDSPQDKATFIHAKIYLADKKYGISVLANLTYSGLNNNVESLSIAENEEEVQQIERDFMRLWLKYENKSMSKDELSSGTTYSIRKALPVSNNLAIINQPNTEGKVLSYYPYYFFQYIFRGSVRSPPLLFEDAGTLLLDGVTRRIFSDNSLANEVNNNPATDYIVNTEGNYKLEIVQPKITDYHEARELAYDDITKRNTRKYWQHYGNRSYERLFVPRRYNISIVKSDFVQVPVWYLDVHGQDGLKHYKIIFASSGSVWIDSVYCPVCQTRTWRRDMTNCEACGKLVCQKCVREIGLIFKKRFCPACHQSRISG